MIPKLIGFLVVNKFTCNFLNSSKSERSSASSDVLCWPPSACKPTGQVKKNSELSTRQAKLSEIITGQNHETGKKNRKINWVDKKSEIITWQVHQVGLIGRVAIHTLEKPKFIC